MEHRAAAVLELVCASVLQFPIALRKKRAGLLRLSGDEVAYALTEALRRVMRPTKYAVRTSLLTGPLCQPLANSALTTSVMIGDCQP